MSNLTLDLRRFVQLPDEGPWRAGVLGMRTIPGDDRLFVVSGYPGSVMYAVSPEDSSVSTIFSPRPDGIRSLADVAFHPEFLQSGAPGYGKLFTLHNGVKPASTAGLNYVGISAPLHGDGVLAEWTATFNAQGEFSGVDSSSYRELFRVSQFSNDHPIGQALFNPFAAPGDDDYGLLYVSHGDSYEFFEGYYAAQSGDTGLGKILRVDPLQAGTAPYGIPESNPFVDYPTFEDEIYTFGHRNPHNLSFAQDANGNAHILLAEIGESRVEEINLISAGGGNYGWSDSEGTIPFAQGNSGASPASFVYPVIQYGHGNGDRNAVAGGYVVDNGSPLDGQYFFADFPTSGDTFTIEFEETFYAVMSGDLEDIDPVDVLRINVRFDADNNPATPLVATSLRDIIMAEASYDGSGRLDVRFGLGPDGELYVMNKRNGWIYQVTNSIATSPADFDFDLDVDADDLAIWSGGVGQSDVGDADNDGDTDGSDFLIWQRELGFGGSGSSEAAAQVPEPSSLLMIGAAIATRARLCRRPNSTARVAQTVRV